MFRITHPIFQRIGIVYVPKKLIGWIIMIAGLIYAVYSFIDIDSRSHSVSDTLRPFIIRLFIIYTAYTLIAFFISTISKNKKNKPD
jgi:hypothetical protein